MTSRWPDQSSLLFVLGMVLGFVGDIKLAYSGATVLSAASDILILAGVGISLSLSVLLALREGKLLALKPFYRGWLLYLGTFIIFLGAYGVVRGNEVRLLGGDVLIYLYLFSGVLAGVSPRHWRIWDTILLMLFFAAAVATITSWWFLGISPAEGRPALTWTTPYLVWNTMFTAMYFLMTLNEGPWLRRVTASMGVGVFFVMAIFFQKRTPFAHLGVLAVATVYLVARQRALFRTSTIANVAMAGLLVVVAFWGSLVLLDTDGYVSRSLDELWKRFFERGTLVATVTEGDRLTDEGRYLLASLLPEELVLGRGLGGSVGVPIDLYGTERVGWLHNGTYTLILKGGGFLLFIWIVLWLRFVTDFMRNRNPELNRYYIVPMIPLVFSFMQVFATYNPSFGFFMMCAGRCMSDER